MTSSDGTRLETIGKSPIAAYAARHAGYRRRMLTWLLWLTGEYGHFGGKVIPVNEPESWHTLDALVHLDAPIVQHTTDTHGTTELTFAIADLLGWEFYPRLADLTDRWLYLLGHPDPLIAVDQLLTHRIQADLILEQWDELLRIAGSIKRGWFVPSVLISRMATDPKPDRTAKALREYGRLTETNFILRWAGDPPLRQRSHAQLNKGENANALRRALGYGNRGRVRARDPEQLHRQLEARRLGANAIHYWNTRYIALSLAHLERLGIGMHERGVRASGHATCGFSPHRHDDQSHDSPR